MTKLLISLFLFSTLFCLNLQAQTRVNIPSKSFDDLELVDISLKAKESRRFVLSVAAQKTIYVAVDTDNEFEVVFIKLINGDKKIDKWENDFDGVEVLTGRDGDYIFEVRNTSDRVYKTTLFFSLGYVNELHGVSSKEIPKANNIHQVDFANFIYTPRWVGDIFQRVRVKNFEYIRGTETGDRFWFRVTKPVYGDVTGDKKDDAIMISYLNGGGSGNFSEAFIYTIKNRKPHLLTGIGGGDRAFGGITGAWIKNGFVFVSYADAGTRGSACCAEFTLTQKYKWNEKELIEIGKIVKRARYPVERILFAKGAFSKSLTVDFLPNEDTKRFLVRAKAGQTLRILTDTGSVYLNDGDAEVAESSDGFTAKLNKNGDYYFHVTNRNNREARASVKVEIK